MHSYQQTKRRKKRVLHAQVTKTVSVLRGKFGYGFTISGQNPCVLSCIVPGSPAQIAGLKAGDLLHVVNGQNVSRACHDDVVRMVGLSTGCLELQVSENYNSSDSSDDDYLPRTKSRYPNRVIHCLEEKDSKYERVSSFCPATKDNCNESLKKDSSCELESDLSSSLTSQEDQGWIMPVDAVCHEFLTTRPLKKQYDLHETTEKQRNELSYCNMSTAKKISSLSAIVKQVPPVVSAVKHRHGDFKQHAYEGVQSYKPRAIQDDTNCDRDSKIPDSVENMKAIVGYIGSIETSNSHTHPYQKLQALRNAVKRLRLEKRVHTLVLMEVRPSGVHLTNAMGKQLALYPSDRIAFSGICPDDERFFGLVTLSAPDQDSNNYMAPGGKYLRLSNSTCHIFMIEPDISHHNAHLQHAETFQIGCITHSQTGQCDQFPISATSLIVYIGSLYRDKSSQIFDTDIVQSQAFADPTNQSEHCTYNSDTRLGLGKEEVSLEQNDQVCVVDVSSGRVQLDISSVPDEVNTNIHILSDKMTGNGGKTTCSYLSNEVCCQQVTQPVNKWTLPAMTDNKDCWKVNRSNSSESNMTVRCTDGSFKQKMEQSEHILLTEQKSILGSDGESYVGEHVLSLSVSEDGHALLETANKGQWQPHEFAFAVPTNPPRSSIHHVSGRSAFHLLKSASAPLEKHRKPETVDLDIGKLSPHVFPHSPPSSSLFFRSPSSPFFPHIDSDEEEEDKCEDDPYIGHSLDHLSKDSGKFINNNSRRFSDGFHMSKKRETADVPDAQKWTMGGSLQRAEVALLRQSFSQSLESLPVDEDTNACSHKLTTACSAHNIVSHTNDSQSKAGRVARWAVHIDLLLKDQLGIDVFTEFLKKEFSDENIQFWKVCEQFRSLTDDSQRKVQAEEIYARYMSIKASDPINVDNIARSHTEKFLDSPSAVMFDVAQHQILQLMKQDSYPRFLKSNLYKNMKVKDLQDSTHRQHDQVQQGFDKNSEKENCDKRRRSILPWKYQKMEKVKPDWLLKNLSKKGKWGANDHSGNNPMNSHISSQSTAAATITTTTVPTSISGRNNSNFGGTKKMARLGIDLSTMRKEVFQQREIHGCEESQVKFCRIIMPDGSTTVVCAKPGQTCQSVIAKLCEKRSIKISSVDVFLLGSDKPLNLSEDMSTLGSKEIMIEKRIVFRLDLPDGKSIGAKSKPNRTIKSALKPILDKYAYSLENSGIQFISSSEIIDLELPVSILDNQRIVVKSDTGTGSQIDTVCQTIDIMGSQKRRVPLFGLFRASEKRVLEKSRQNEWQSGHHSSKR